MVLLTEKDKKSEIGATSGIIKREQPVTHRLLCANTEEDQTELWDTASL